MCVGVDHRSGEHHDDVEQGHDEHRAAGDGGQALERVQTAAGYESEDQQNRKGHKLNVNRREGIVFLRVLEDRPAQGLQTAGALACDIGDVAGPVGPACEVGHLGAHGVMHPGGDAAAFILKGGAELADHQRVGDEVEGEHQDPTEVHLRSVKVYEAVQDVAKAPNRGKCHERKHLPLDFLVLVHFFHRFQSYFWAAW